MLQLDHLFIITPPQAPEATQLKAIGWIEGPASTHPGQGTANRRFFFPNFTLELLFISNEYEATHGAGKGLRFVERFKSCETSLFGIVTRIPNTNTTPSFPSWKYFPDYFQGNLCFYVGNNSDQLTEPLCICMPPALPKRAPNPKDVNNRERTLTRLELHVPAKEPSEVLQTFSKIEGVSILYDQPNHVVLEFNHQRKDYSIDLSPGLPLEIRF